MPFDAKHGVIPNDGGRVAPGVYATGWIKRGPVGLIGHTKSDALETITNLINDKPTWWTPSEPAEESIIELLTERHVDFVDWADWLKIDAKEVALGEAQGRERIKLVEREDFLRVAKS